MPLLTHVLESGWSNTSAGYTFLLDRAPLQEEAMKQVNGVHDRRDNGRERIAAIYVRTSTADKQDTAAQERELRILVQARGWRIYKVYRDHGYSGTKASRP